MVPVVPAPPPPCPLVPPPSPPPPQAAARSARATVAVPAFATLRLLAILCSSSFLGGFLRGASREGGSFVLPPFVPAVGRRVLAGHRAARGSRASRRPSPNRLNAMTVMKIARPGTIMNVGEIVYSPVAADSMSPHEAVGGFTPTPR